MPDTKPAYTPLGGNQPPLLQPSNPGTVPEPQFSEGDIVNVRTDALDKDGNKVEHVVEGCVRRVFPTKDVPFVTIRGKDYYSAVEIVEETFDGEEKLIRWSSDGGFDAIPSTEFHRIRKIFHILRTSWQEFLLVNLVHLLMQPYRHEIFGHGGSFS